MTWPHAEPFGVAVSASDDLVEDVHPSVVLDYDSLLGSGDGEGIFPSDPVTSEVALLLSGTRGVPHR